MLDCPLCLAAATRVFHEDERRAYLRCDRCLLAFVPAAHHLSAEGEKAEYDLHNNDPQDVRYRAFLNRLCRPMLERLAPGSLGLDIGSGPGPTLSLMFAEAGHHVELFDPYYANDDEVFCHTYDFVTASEVVEHLRRPKDDLDRAWSCLKAGGVLGIMTQLLVDHQAFVTWRYKDDLTHVAFFSQQTFKWLAEAWHAELFFARKDVVLLTKRNGR